MPIYKRESILSILTHSLLLYSEIMKLLRPNLFKEPYPNWGAVCLNATQADAELCWDICCICMNHLDRDEQILSEQAHKSLSNIDMISLIVDYFLIFSNKFLKYLLKTRLF